MKKFFGIILISICFLLILSGCDKNKVKENSEAENTEETIKIMDDVYVDYINDIYLDSAKYINKNLEIEGLFTIENDKNNNPHFYVYRWVDVEENSHGESSHNHGESSDNIEEKFGLEFIYNENFPKKNDWIKVIGKLKEKNNRLIIEANSVKVMKEKGLEKVKSFY